MAEATPSGRGFWDGMTLLGFEKESALWRLLALPWMRVRLRIGRLQSIDHAHDQARRPLVSQAEGIVSRVSRRLGTNDFKKILSHKVHRAERNLPIIRKS